MNKDLEIIKELCDVEVPYDEVCSIYANALSEIQAAAERMAAEIEKKEKIIQDQFNIINRYQATIMPMVDKNYEDFQREIARLENELKAIHEMGRLKAENAQLRAEINEVKK